jgi:hypothetical protein
MNTSTSALALPGIVTATTSRPAIVTPWPAPCAVKRSNVWPPPALSTSVRYMTAEFVAVADKHARRNRRVLALKSGVAATAAMAGALLAAVAIF